MTKWSPAALRLLRMKLAVLFYELPTQRQFLTDAGFTGEDLARIAWHSMPLVCWYNILELFAAPRGKVDAVFAALKQELPADVELSALVPEAVAAPVPEPRAPEWRGGNLEKTLGSIPTLVPVRWLAIGAARARAVARVNLPNGYGTGFLVRARAGDLLLTNHHVIPDAATAATSTLTFNFEEAVGGAPVVADTWELDATRFWTSPTEGGDDWTAVGVAPRKLDGQLLPASERYEPLTLAPIGVVAKERVNIIQHPSGLAKRVSCVSNVVAWVGDNRVQYLTDTQPGSSGAPVFNKDWQVVAVHHAGGLTGTVIDGHFFRNQGIAIAAIHKALVDQGVIDAG